MSWGALKHKALKTPPGGVVRAARAPEGVVWAQEGGNWENQRGETLWRKPLKVSLHVGADSTILALFLVWFSGIFSSYLAQFEVRLLPCSDQNVPTSLLVPVQAAYTLIVRAKPHSTTVRYP